jgi:peptidoglycan-N-acetylglucosamine deacetylase
MATNISVCLSFDFDAISVWLGSLNAASPSAISRGEFGAVATERLLQMLARWEIRSTWFIPGSHHRYLPRLGAPNRRCGT